MNASELAILTFASCFACACAETYGVPPAPEATSLTPPIAGVEASFGGAAAMPSVSGTGGVGGMAPPLGEPCVRNDMKSCPCEGTDVQGQRICVFDMASPMDGFFSECQGCPAPEPVDMPEPEPTCTDAMHNGAETSTDCGGPDCTPCALGSACMIDADCADATCVRSACTMPPSGGAGGAGGTSGSDAGEPPIDEPVQDCEGVPEGTECDRDCILPTNTARCNSRGNCSCL